MTKAKTVVLSADRKLLTVFQNDIEINLTNEEIERVELYEQKYLGTFGYHNYLVIYATGNRHILLTDFTIPLLLYDKMLEKFLRKKPRAYFKKQFNYIDEGRFKPSLLS